MNNFMSLVSINLDNKKKVPSKIQLPMMLQEEIENSDNLVLFVII